MKLYELPNNCIIKIEGLQVNGKPSDILIFRKVDGMYSICETLDGEIIHLNATAECELSTLKNINNEKIKD